MRTVDIVYFYEHIDRELDVACIIKYLLDRRYGLNMKIVQHPFGQLLPGMDLDLCRPRVVALPHAYASGIYTPYLLDWPDAVYINLMWEQLFYDANRGTKIPRGEFATKHILHHAWGEFAAQYLQKVGVPPSHIFVNGQPAYALYGEPYRRYYPSRDELTRRHNLDPDKRWVFFPENYNWAFYDETVLKGAQGKNVWVADQIYPLRDFCRNSLVEMMRWCSAVARNGGVEFIVRPRPAVPLEKFMEVARQASPDIPESVHIIKDESVREWILASDAVISSYSTSLIEAAIANKPIYMVAPYPIPQAVYAKWHDFVPQVSSVAELQAVCFSPTVDLRLGDWARTLMMAHGDPIQRLVDFLAGVALGHVAPPPRVSRDDIVLPKSFERPHWLAFPYHQARRKYQHLAVRIARQPVRPEAKFEKDLASCDSIERRTGQWAAVLEPIS